MNDKDKHGINILPVHFIVSAINDKHDKEIESFLLSYWGLSTLAGNIYILIGERSEPLSGHVNGSSRYIYTYVNS